jgi:hypothetical protein
MVARPDTSNVDDPVLAAGEPGGGRRRRPVPRWLDAAVRVTGGVLVALLAVEVAVWECFLVMLRVGRVPVPLSAVAAVAGNVLLARAIVTVTGRRPAALLPPVLWLLTVLVFAAPRAEGDLVVPGTWQGLAFLFLGALAGAFGAATSMTSRPWLPRGSPGGPVGGSGKVSPRG